MKIEVVQKDITKLRGVECIVNAANIHLCDGAGINGAIQRKSGPALLKYCENTFPNGIETGEAVLTPSFDLLYTTEIRYIIHTAGPIYQDGLHGEPEQLENSYYNSLLLANIYNIPSIAFPCISTGIYGYNPKDAADVVYNLISNLNSTNFLNDEVNQIESLIFCCFTQQDYLLYNLMFEKELQCK